MPELDNSWSRSALSYKAGDTPYDSAKIALNTATMWTAGTKTCSNVSCHNGRSVGWTETVSCASCHTQLPR
ncbi:MAG: CxxxxCH/CxxCH domain-containing protein [Nitrospirae bacterium]|nr:CxxxxCH/CxxCH domain-containing protein [Nitrospirota bacterium]